MFPETGVMRKAAALEGIAQENRAGRKWAEVAFADVEAVAVTSDAALLTYRADARWEHESTIRSVLATSLYVRRASGWRLAFHQQSYPEGVKALAALPSLPRDTRRHAFGALAGRAAAIGRLRDRRDRARGGCHRTPCGRGVCGQAWPYPAADDRPVAGRHPARRQGARRSCGAPVLNDSACSSYAALLTPCVRTPGNPQSFRGTRLATAPSRERSGAEARPVDRLPRARCDDSSPVVQTKGVRRQRRERQRGLARPAPRHQRPDLLVKNCFPSGRVRLLEGRGSDSRCAAARLL